MIDLVSWEKQRAEFFKKFAEISKDTSEMGLWRTTTHVGKHLFLLTEAEKKKLFAICREKIDGSILG